MTMTITKIGEGVGRQRGQIIAGGFPCRWTWFGQI